MKVVFKLNKKQFTNAREIVSEVEKFEGDEDSYYCGNLLGWMGHSFSFNHRQNLNLTDDGKITYEGERHPLIQDGGMVALLRIGTGYSLEKEPYSCLKKLEEACASSWDFLKVVSYETTDPRLSWWETTSDFVWKRSTLEEWISAKDKRGYSRPNLGRMLTLDQKSCVVDIMTGKPDKQLTASYDAVTIRKGKLIAGFLEDHLAGFQDKADKAILQAFYL